MLTVKRSIGRLDVLLALLAIALGTLLMYANVYEPEDGLDVPFAAIPAFLLVSVPVLWRSIDPLRALGAVLLGLAVHTAVFGEVVRCGAAFPALAIVAYAAGRRLQGLDARIGLGLGLAGALLVGAGEFLGFGVVVVGLPLVTFAWGAGRLVASRGVAVYRAEHGATPVLARS